MAQTVKLKRSAVSGNTPTTSDLALGEIVRAFCCSHGVHLGAMSTTLEYNSLQRWGVAERWPLKA